VKFDDDDNTTTKPTETENFYLTYSMIATRKEGKREEISNWNSMHYINPFMPDLPLLERL
jgi:hypothetical protein